MRASVAGDRSGRRECLLANRPCDSLICWIIKLIQSCMDINRPTFNAAGGTRDAVERRVKRLCEGATKLGAQAEELAPGLQWLAVRTFGNALRHTYDQIDPARMRQTTTDDLRRMAAVAQAALARLDKSPEAQ